MTKPTRINKQEHRRNVKALLPELTSLRQQAAQIAATVSLNRIPEIIDLLKAVSQHMKDS